MDTARLIRNIGEGEKMQIRPEKRMEQERKNRENQEQEKEKMYQFWLAGIRGISAEKKCRIYQWGGSAQTVYNIEETAIKKSGVLNEREWNVLKESRKDTGFQERYRKMQDAGIHFIPYDTKRYPKYLLELSDHPFALFVKGNLPDETARRVAIVGARKCTAYGERYAMEFGRELAAAGIQIISGLARGIDGMGQRGALNGKGKTFAVMGCGAEQCYPREHQGLYEDILMHGGGIISEYEPGVPPLAQNFPARNRIISGLSDAVLVMEARERSGSLITVDMALEQGRDVYALPGPIDSTLSSGCNRLIQQGAGILLSSRNLLKEWGIDTEKLCVKRAEKMEQKKKVLESTENLVYSCVGLYPKNVESILRETGIELRELLSILVSLELQGYIREISKNYYIKVK